MFRFLLGVLVGSVATALYLDRNSARSIAAGGGVDELAGAANNVIADPELNAGDATPAQSREVRA